MKNRIFKVISFALTIAMVISVCGVNFGIAYADEANGYYVQMGGTGDGSTPESPAATVKDAIDKINADGLGSGDTANIYIMQRSDWSTYTSDTANEHGMTSWSKNNEVPAAHAAEIVVQPYSGNSGETYIATGDIYNQTSCITLSGPTTLKNLIVVSTVNSYNMPSIRTNANNFKIIGSKEKNPQYAYMTAFNPLKIEKKHSIQTYLGITGSASEKVEVTYDAYYGSHSRATSSCTQKIILANNGDAAEEYKEDYNLTLDLGNYGAPQLRIGNGYRQLTFRKNLNINVKSTDYLTIEKPNGWVVVKGAVQMIYPDNMKYESFQGGTKNNPAINFGEFSNMSIDGGAYLIQVPQGNSDLLTFTDTAGVYTVKSGYSVKATDENGNVTMSVGSTLTLAAPGKYTVVSAREESYYVQMGGTGDGSSPESPAATVKDAIDKINADGLVAGNTANIYIMQRSDWSTYTSDTENEHGMTSWSKNNEVPAAHAAEIVVQPYSGNSGETYLATGDIYNQNSCINLSGPTTFQNLIIVSTIDSNYDTPAIRTNGNNFKFIGSKEKDPQYAHMSGFNPLKLTKRHSIQTFLGKTGSASEKVNVTYESYYGSHARTQANCPEKIFIANNGGATEEYKEDYNLTLDMGNYGAPRVRIGNGYYQLTFRKNLNINVKSTDYLMIEKAPGWVVVKGAVQMIYPESMKYESFQNSKQDNPAVDFGEFDKMTIDGGAYLIQVPAAASDLLTFTDTAGIYNVKDGYYVTATDENGVKYSSKNGKLTLPAGKYTVKESNKAYTNDYETITVNADAPEIIFADEPVLQKSGYAFIGWKNEETGEYVTDSSVLKAGDVLKAQYVEFSSENFAIKEIQIRQNNLGLRYVIEQNKEAVNSLPNVKESGAITLATDTAQGRDIYLDTPVVIEYGFDADAKDDTFIPKTVGETPAKIVASNILEETETTKQYTVCITDIGESKYETFYLVKGYIKYTDNNGADRVVYTDDDESSLYKTAKEALAAGEKSEVYDNIVNYVENTAWPQTLSKFTVNSTTYTDPEDSSHTIKALNGGIYLRSLTIDTGKNITGGKFAFYSDQHIAYINEFDIYSKNRNALSSYRGRSWLRDGAAIRKQITVYKFLSASNFDRMISGGDSVDYLTWGALNAVDNLIVKKAVNNNTVMVVGNHDPKSLSQPDNKSLTDISVDEGNSVIGTIWPNDLNYHSEIVKDNNGKDNYMIISLNNGQSKYLDGQAAKLEKDIADAKSKGIPAFIFQHEMMYTFDEANPVVYIGKETGKMGSPDSYSYIEDKELVGKYNTDTETAKVCDIIRKNSDVIKGIFCGHTHGNSVSKITATDENGNLLKDSNGNQVYIMQHNVAGSHYGLVMSITVK